MTRATGAAEAYLAKTAALIASLDRQEIDKGVAMVIDAWDRGAQIITLGNGGSALTGLHYVMDWNKGVQLATGRPIYGRTLTDNLGLMMAWANDTEYANIFVGQLQGVMRPGDLVIAISGSGQSENVVRAIDHANTHGGVTLGLCGYSGGRVRERSQHAVWVRADDMQLCEDAHMMFGHIVMQRLCGMT